MPCRTTDRIEHDCRSKNDAKRVHRARVGYKFNSLLTLGWSGLPARADAPWLLHRPLGAGQCEPPFNVSVRPERPPKVCEVKMPATSELPGEVHAAKLRRDASVQKAFEAVRALDLRAWSAAVAYVNATVLFVLIYFATKEAFVALALAVAVAALYIAGASYWASRKLQAAVISLIDVVRENEARRS